MPFEWLPGTSTSRREKEKKKKQKKQKTKKTKVFSVQSIFCKNMLLFDFAQEKKRKYSTFA